MATLLPCIALAFIIPLLAKLKFKHELTAKEVALQGVIMSVLCLILYGAGTHTPLGDVQILNGEVVAKKGVKKSCPSGWVDYADGFCSNYSTRRKYTHTTCTTVNKRRSCTRHYKTQYNHDYAWEKRWYVTTSFGRLQINRINRRGDQEPPRWTEVEVGDPASTAARYTNYMKAAAHNIINPNKGVMERYAKDVPTYPKHIVDYYKSNKVLTVGVSLKNHAEWNYKLAEHLKVLGPVKQANVVVIVTNILDPEYRYAVEEKWLGGKKNDVIVLIGADKEEIKWVDTITLAGNAGNELMTVKMRDNLLDHKVVDIKVLDVISSTVLKHFDRKAMQEFKYLEDQIEPPTWVVIACYLMSLVLGLGLTAYFIKNETV